MNLRIYIALAAVATLGVEACHHLKQTYPPDVYPDQNARRRRSIAEVVYTIYPTTRPVYTIYPTTRPTVPDSVDVAPDESDFFTKCMQEKTGSMFRSWRSVVEFVIRDTRWYSSTEEQYCPQNSDRDPGSVACWQNRLNSLLKPTSSILQKAKECVREYILPSLNVPRRVNQHVASVVSSIQQRLETCLGVTIRRFDGCLRSGLITSRNLRRYPSLRNWNALSVDQFLLEHVSDCRITSRYANGRNIYNQVCPSAVSGLRPCLSTMYDDLVRTSSPLFTAQKSCTTSFLKDKCRNVQCNGHSSCNKNTGRCECDSGYVANAVGFCQLQNKCALVFCGGRHETCNQNTGLCECRSGYKRNIAGSCEIENKCAAVFCGGRHETCNQNTGLCECRSGYKRNIAGDCESQTTDPCQTMTCAPSKRCVDFGGSGYCICKFGLPYAPVCIGSNMCTNVNCGANAECTVFNERAMCRCNVGYVRRDDACQRDDACAYAQCHQNMDCRTDISTFPVCVCKAGYVQNTQGFGCVLPDKCAGVTCPTNSYCMNGNCICTTGFQLSNGFCIRKDPCANVRCEQNMECKDGKCVCRDGYVPSPDIRPGCVAPDRCAAVQCPVNTVCRDGNCVCSDGFVWFSGFCIDACATVRCPANSDCHRGNCKCKDEFELSDGICKRKNPCALILCAANMKCENGDCVCQDGFVPAPINEPGCVRPDPCAAVQCPTNSDCLNGNCICKEGFDWMGGFCIRKNPCFGVVCVANMRCENGECVCEDGFVPALNNLPGCVKPDPCDGVTCPDNSQCVAGTCVCDTGFVESGDRCISSTSCPRIPCGESQQCIDGKCECLPGFVLVPEGVACVRDQGTWREWGQWSSCSLTCGVGEQVRFRNCDGNNCVGISVEANSCTEQACEGTWMKWGSWSQCSVTCGGGQQSRIRRCDGSNCPGDDIERSACNTDRCDGTWTEWGSWGQCSATCNGGQQSRNRQCFGGRDCPGNPAQTRACSTEECLGTWMEWGSWSRCSVTCGGGQQFRSRQCVGSNCDGDSLEIRDCNTPSCVDERCVGVTCPGELVCTSGNCACPSGSQRTPQDTCVQCAAGKEFSACAPPCYDRCDSAATPDDVSACFGNCRQGVYCVCPSGQVERSSTDSTCVTRDQCPVVTGGWGPWGSWGTCSKSCDTGTRSRSRTCQGVLCPDGNDSVQTEACNTPSCQSAGNCQLPKVFNSCPTRCPTTCQNRGIQIQCENGCREGNVQCVCPDNMVERSSGDSTCVPTSQCVATGLCLPNPCKNRGTCFSVGSMYICNCLEGYSGRNCEIGCGSVCTPNGRCESGSCVCNNGFQSDGNGGCTRI